MISKIPSLKALPQQSGALIERANALLQRLVANQAEYERQMRKFDFNVSG
jgi:hypothetical protein